MKNYNVREFLNAPESPSTGSITVFDGEVQWRGDREPNRESWVEVADCHSKVRLHRCYEDSQEAYMKKIKKMRDILDRYIIHLEIKDEKISRDGSSK